IVALLVALPIKIGVSYDNWPVLSRANPIIRNSRTCAEYSDTLHLCYLAGAFREDFYGCLATGAGGPAHRRCSRRGIFAAYPALVRRADCPRLSGKRRLYPKL